MFPFKQSYSFIYHLVYKFTSFGSFSHQILGPQHLQYLGYGLSSPGTEAHSPWSLVLRALICIFWSFHSLLQYFFSLRSSYKTKDPVCLRGKGGLLPIKEKRRFPIEKNILPLRRLNRLVLIASQLVKFSALEKSQSKNSLWM